MPHYDLHIRSLMYNTPGGAVLCNTNHRGSAARPHPAGRAVTSRIEEVRRTTEPNYRYSNTSVGVTVTPNPGSPEGDHS